ncbi:MAG TPA: phosphate signaling complex protein PhoU [Thermoplasmata archaeon]|nr:phosphate signaling complex protein PhoU [Thermoplasmata archaeon]
MPQTAERKALSEGLEQLNENMVTMAQLSELAIRTAVATVDGQAPGTLDEPKPNPADVFVLDQEIYGLKQQVETDCINLIALHAPVARDLRTITSSLEVTTHLDRIGRYAKDIAEASLRLSEADAPATAHSAKLTRMVDLTIEMVDTAVEAFVHRDATPVRNIIHADDAVDQLHAEVFQEVVERMNDRSLAPKLGAQYILINRYLERSADHAVNIGEQVLYMLTGERPPRVKHGVPKPAST